MTDQPLKITRRLFLGGGAAGTAAVLGGCNFQGGGASADGGDGGGGDGPTGAVRMVVTSGSIDSLDPHYVNNAMIVVPAGLLEGLVLSNDEGTEAIPAAAESWEVSEDGTVYTFTMRAGATWSNGDPVTAQDAEWSFRRLLSPTGAGSNYAAGASSYLGGLGIKGADDHLSGANDDWAAVGVSASDERTLVVELVAPNADFLLLMSHYSMVLVHPASVEEHGSEWMRPENWVGNGPFVPETWEPTTSLVLAANDAYWDHENVGVATVELVLGMDSTASLASFEAGDIDIAVGSASTLAERDDLEENIAQIEGYTVRYLQRMWGGHPSSTDARVRQALSLAIDRESIAGLSPVDVAGTTLLPGNVVPGWDPSLAIGYDVDEARRLMEQAGLDQVPPLRVQYNFENAWLPMLADQWQDAFDTDVTIDILESGVHSETRWKPYEDESTISLYAGTFSGLPTMNNWINNIFSPDYVMQFSMSTQDWMEYQEIQADEALSDTERADALTAKLRSSADPDAVEFADLAAEAMSTLDDDERLARFLEAAQVRESLAYTLPITWSGRMFLVQDRISGFVPRPSPEIAYYKYLSASDA